VFFFNLVNPVYSSSSKSLKIEEFFSIEHKGK